jgi:hypothetical protein
MASLGVIYFSFDCLNSRVSLLLDLVYLLNNLLTYPSIRIFLLLLKALGVVQGYHWLLQNSTYHYFTFQIFFHDSQFNNAAASYLISINDRLHHGNIQLFF